MSISSTRAFAYTILAAAASVGLGGAARVTAEPAAAAGNAADLHGPDAAGMDRNAVPGRLREWWTAEDRKHFEKSGQALVEQFNQYKPFPDLAVNGKLTLSENLADLAGLAAAHDAWLTSLGGKPAPQVGGLTGDQQFYVAFAQAWRGKAREAALRQQIITDGHSPGMYRALIVRNLDAWYEAFGVKPGQKQYLPPEQRVKVW